MISSVRGFNLVQSPFLYSAFMEISNSDFSETYWNWVAVSKMETAGWTSKLYTEANNPWGMKVPKVRPNRVAGAYVSRDISGKTSMDFAQYNGLIDACDDIILWMQYTKFPTNRLSIQEHILAMQQRGYFGAESLQSYLGKVIAWLDK